MEINSKMTIAEIIKQNPESAKVLQKFGMHCIGCAVAARENLEDAAKTHGIELNKLIEALNA
jgi:hybrid cluster-associated redox disulfide protein